MEELIYWLALQEKYWIISPEEIEWALKNLGSMESVWNAQERDLIKLGLRKKSVKSFCEYKKTIDLKLFERRLEETRQKGIRLVPYTDNRYPILLKNARWSKSLKAPRSLFHKGSLLEFDNCIAVAGTRQCSDYGLKNAYTISRKLAQDGYIVVSGLALGVDTEAHKGALDAKGETIAVLAWMDPIYPGENIELSREIQSHGCLLSECYRKPRKNIKWRFVERNKIISGVSKLVVIIETGEKGGTIQLATMALGQGRKVLVLQPLKENNRARKGYETLLGMGAISFRSYDDLSNSVMKEQKTESKYQSLISTF